MEIVLHVALVVLVRQCEIVLHVVMDVLVRKDEIVLHVSMGPVRKFEIIFM